MDKTKEEKDKKSTNYIRFDWAIKRLLRNKADFGAVNGLLSCLFDKQIFITNVLESEGNQEEENSKFNRVDVLVEDESGEKFIIEIQNNYQVDYYHRMLFGVSKVICDYLQKGDPYDKIKKVYSVNIVYFELGQGEDYVYHGTTEFKGRRKNDILELTKTQKWRYQREKVGDIFPEYYILRVEKFDEVATTPLDQWIYYLKTTKIPDAFTAPGLSEIRAKQRVEDLPEAERKAYYRHLEQVSYEEGVIEHSRSEGIIEGRAEGRAEGEQLKTIEIAKKAKTRGMSFDQISEITNLSIEEIEKL
jgi:predicted transposase/invertase (TIGR01784 family)